MEHSLESGEEVGSPPLFHMWEPISGHIWEIPHVMSQQAKRTDTTNGLKQWLLQPHPSPHFCAVETAEERHVCPDSTAPKFCGFYCAYAGDLESRSEQCGLCQKQGHWMVAEALHFLDQL